MSQNLPLYEPRFYERMAQQHVTRLFPGPTFVNVRWGLIGSLATRHELDALVFQTRHAVPVEIKAHPLSDGDTDEIVAKYGLMGFPRIILIAPSVSAKASRRLADSKAPYVEFIVFHPDLDTIRDWYCTIWPQKVPAWTHAALRSGRHHVRFVLSQPTNEGRFVIGQQRTRVYSAGTVLRLVACLPAPPARILWTPQRFRSRKEISYFLGATSKPVARTDAHNCALVISLRLLTTPRDLIARGSRVTSIGGFVPIDIDGDRLHQARHACQISTSEAVCQFCMRY